MNWFINFVIWILKVPLQFNTCSLVVFVIHAKVVTKFHLKLLWDWLVRFSIHMAQFVITSLKPTFRVQMAWSI